jgi:hypothetical protein
MLLGALQDPLRDSETVLLETVLLETVLLETVLPQLVLPQPTLHVGEGGRGVRLVAP